MIGEEGQVVVDDRPLHRDWRRVVRPFPLGVAFLFCLQPLVAFLDANRSQIDEPWRVLGYGVASGILGASAVVVIGLVIPRLAPDGVGVAVAVVATSFFHVDLWAESNPAGRALVGSVVLLVVVTGLLAIVGYRISRHAAVRQALTVFGLIFVLVPLIGAVAASSSPPAAGADSVSTDDIPELGPDAPNVYWFVFDGYARNDQLETILGFDNSAFYEELRDRGFVVSETSRAAYARTHLSLGSTLQMDYAATPDNDIADEFEMFAPIVRGNNAVVDRFEKHGYSIVYSPYPGLEWSKCTTDLADVCVDPLRPDLALDELDQAIVDLTPIGWFNLFGSLLSDPVHVVENVEAENVPEPYFVFAHMKMPHWPFRYDDSCGLRSRPFDVNGRSLEVYEDAYENEIGCLNDVILESVDLIEETDPSAVIVLQSDHGSDFQLNWGNDPSAWSDEALIERFGALNAMRLPASCGELPVEGSSLVNTFRLVFSCIEVEPIELVDVRSYLSPWEEIEAIEEIDPDRFGGG